MVMHGHFQMSEPPAQICIKYMALYGVFYGFIQFLHLNVMSLKPNFAIFLKLTPYTHIFLLILWRMLLIDSLLNRRQRSTSGILRNHGFVTLIEYGKVIKEIGVSRLYVLGLHIYVGTRINKFICGSLEKERKFDFGVIYAPRPTLPFLL